MSASGWSYGFCNSTNRDVGYGVTSHCDHPGCKETIDRGMSYCCGQDVSGGDHGCGLFFCTDHLILTTKGYLCERCIAHKPPFDPTPDHIEWLKHKLASSYWSDWRRDNPDEVKKINDIIRGKR